MSDLVQEYAGNSLCEFFIDTVYDQILMGLPYRLAEPVFDGITRSEETFTRMFFDFYRLLLGASVIWVPRLQTY